MEDNPEEPSGLDGGRYVSVQSRLRQLKSQLPTSAVATLAREVIRQIAQDGLVDGVRSPQHPEIAKLCEALIADDDHAGAHFINDARSEGATIESVYLNYLAAAARLLGTWWEEDRVSFSQVTVGTSRMYAIMRSLRREMPVTALSPNRAAVFATVPGEEHILGVRMAADLFRKDGWEIDLLIGKTHDELVNAISGSEMVVIGLSASGASALEALSKLVLALRIKNPVLKIFVSGHIAEDCEDTLSLMDVDGVAADYATAKYLLEAAVATRSAI
ncbi:MAG: cobalamin-dependent protein [Pseudomonadota bacterium]